MKALKLIIAGALLAAVVTVPFWIQRRAHDELRARNELLRKQALDSERLAVENVLLSNILAKARTSQNLSDAQLSELLRLRNEVSQLRSLLRQTNLLAGEIRQMRDGLREIASENDGVKDSPTALLEDHTELQRARLEKLEQWLAGRPEEMIPELRFLSEGSWLKSAEWTRVTDEEYRSWISAQRSNAEMKFAGIAFKALKEYARDNNGGFPTDLSQLTPYFETPIEDAVLQRYEIVPAKSLIKFLAEASGDRVITQKAPVNKQFDTRVAISATGMRVTLAEGRWDPVR